MAGAVLWSPARAQSAHSSAIGIPVHFTDIRQAAGITFKHDATMTENKNYLETMGSGVGWIDYDQDGLMDLYFVQSAATDWYKPPRPLRSRSITTMAMGRLPTLRKKPGSARWLLGQGVAWGIMTTMVTPTCW